MPTGRAEFFADREERDKEEQCAADLAREQHSFEKTVHEAGEKIVAAVDKKYPTDNTEQETKEAV